MRTSLPTLAALLALCALAIVYAVDTPAPLPATAPATEFSAERAMAHVRLIAREPRPVASEAHARVRTYLLDRISALGIEPMVQSTTGVGTRYAAAGRVYNVLARIPGLLPPRPRGAVLLAVHYDGVAAGPAAADDAAAVGAVLETMRALRAGPMLANDVIVLFADGEEAGLIGAAAFAREHPWARDVGVILNFEARGVHGPSLMFETGRGNSDVIRFLRGVRGARATSLSTAVYRALPNDTDLSELSLLDRPAMNFAFIGGVERYHTPEDDTTHLSRGSVQHHGEQMLALARSFGAARLPRPDTRDAVFFDLPLLGIMAYSETIAIVWGVAGALLIVAAIVLLKKRDGRPWRGLVTGALALIVSVAVAGGVAYGAAALLLDVHARVGGAPQWRAVYAAAIALLAVAVVAGTLALARRVADALTLHAGALVLLGAIALYVSIAAPGASFMIAWPALLAATAAVITLASRSALAGAIAQWGAAVGILFIMVPLLYLMVCVALGIAGIGAALLGVLVALAAWLLVPHLEAMGAGKPWRVTVGALAGAVMLFAAGALTVRTDAGRPAGASLVYAVDADSGAAWLSGFATTRAARAWLDRSVAALATDQPRPAPAWLGRVVGARRPASVAARTTPAPSAVVLHDSTTADARVVTLRVRAAPRTSSVEVVAERGDVREAWVDGRAVDRSRYRRRPARWALDFVAPPDSGFLLRLSFAPGQDRVVSLLARSAGIPFGVPVPQRPEGILPIQVGDGTYVYRRVELDRSGTREGAPARGAGAPVVREAGRVTPPAGPPRAPLP